MTGKKERNWGEVVKKTLNTLSKGKIKKEITRTLKSNWKKGNKKGASYMLLES